MKFRIFLQSLVLIGLWLSACQSNAEIRSPIVIRTPPPERCSPTDIAEVDEILIGATVPLSKPGAATAGTVMQAAFTMAVEDINLQGGILGKPLRLIIRDTQGLPERGTVVAQQLLLEDCVVALVGEYHSAVGLTIMEVAHQYQVPVIFAETYNDDITAAGYPEVFRIAPTSSFTAQMDARWLAEVGDYNKNGVISGLIIAEQTDYGKGQIDRAITWFPEFGIRPEIISVDLSSEDFSATIADVQALEMKPDAIFIKVTGETSYLLQQQIMAADLGPNQQTLLVANQVALNHQDYWQAIPDGVYIVVPRVGPWESTVTSIGADFAKKYQITFERWPEPYAFEAYDALQLMANAIQRAGSLEPELIIKALEATDLELTSGRYRFPYGADNPAGGYVPEYMWHQWPDVPLLFLQYTALNQPSQEMAVIWPASYRTIPGPFIRPSE